MHYGIRNRGIGIKCGYFFGKRGKEREQTEIAEYQAYITDLDSLNLPFLRLHIELKSLIIIII